MTAIANKKVVKHTQTFNPDDVIEMEREHLELNNQQKISGLAISGGGIRSASFGLGVMQALVKNDQLHKMVYMSTVSGGGYLGSALTWALKQGGKNTGTRPHNFPLGKPGICRVKGTILKENRDDKDENKLLDFIRQHGSYLTPTASLDIISFIGVVLRSMVMSLFAYFSFLTIAMTGSLWLLYQITNWLWKDEKIKGILTRILPQQNPFSYTEQTVGITDKLSIGVMIFVGIVILVIVFLKGFLYSLGTFFRNDKITRWAYLSFIKGQKWIGLMLKLSLTCFVFGSLPFVCYLIKDLSTLLAASSGSTLFGSLVGLWQYKKAQNKEKSTGMKSDLLIYTGAFALFYGVLLSAYLFARKFFLKDENLEWDKPVLFLILVLAAIVFGRFVNLNLIGPHHVWRNRLMEAFMPNKNAVETNTWQPATEADNALIENMCDEHNPQPYHIINTNVILSNSPKVDYSGRGGDNYIISPLYCGSDATGWKLTKTLEKNKNKRITLATAMATSAAALNPNAGVSGEGVTRNIVVSLLLSMLNLRLGYWTRNPGKKKSLGSPNFFVPGLTSEILRLGLSEKSSHIQLSDGGHYENLALYELVRRKLDLIIVSDGGADPEFNFDDLANAIEKVRVDFGTNIYFIDNYKADNILPGTAGHDKYQEKYAIAKKGFAIADINYQDGTKGTLVYLKLAMIENLPTDVYSYKGMHPSFPHESTADQFFNEKQFEAYRELGYGIALQMMDSEKGKELFPKNEEVKNTY